MSLNGVTFWSKYFYKVGIQFYYLIESLIQRLILQRSNKFKTRENPESYRIEHYCLIEACWEESVPITRSTL